MEFKKLTPEELRKHKGISFTGITTVFLCHDGKGKLFLAKRSKNTRDEHGRWDSGGGGLKHGQTIDDNLRREVLEEYGVEAVESKFIGYYDAFRESLEGLPTHWLAMCFAVQVDSDKVQIMEPEMVDGYGWFSLDELPQPMHSQFEKFMGLYGDKLKSILKA